VGLRERENKRAFFNLSHADMKLYSPAFQEGKQIPKRHTCDGENRSPALRIKGIPQEAKALALLLVDPDAPGGDFYHWLMWNIPLLSEIDEAAAPGIQGINDFGKRGYGDPCPPAGTHRYYFSLFALRTELHLSSAASPENLQEAIEDQLIARTELMGTYRRDR
jgi:Raf kinase inhibitor-like YbhB/YbcL family protein